MLPKISIQNKKHIILLNLLIAVVIIIGAFILNDYEENLIKKDINNELKAIADLKINQIVGWKKERIGDAKIFSELPIIKNSVEDLKAGTNNKVSQKTLRQLLEDISQVYDYFNITITTLNGDVLFSLDDSVKNIDYTLLSDEKDSLAQNKIVVKNIHKGNHLEEIHFEILAPIVNINGKPSGLLIFTVNLNQFLFPLIQTWPNPSKTAETLIIRKDSNSVLFLNELRFRKNTALNLRIPLTRKEVPAVQAVLGYKGIWEGKDYRDEDVLSYIDLIPGTHWYMISKIDKSEIYSELYAREIIVAISTFILLVLVSTGLFGFYNFRQRNLFRNMYITEKKFHTIEKEFKTTLYSIGDAVISTDKDGYVKYMNSIAEKLTGWSESEAKGNNLTKVFKIVNEETRLENESPVKKVLDIGKVVGLANHTLLISKNGKETPIADSGAPIRNDSGEIIGVVLVFRDQTKERISQKLILDGMLKYKNLFNSIRDSLIVADNKRNIFDCNPAFIDLFGYNSNDLIGKETSYIYSSNKEFQRVGSMIKDNINNPNFLITIYYKKKNGEVFPGETNIFYLKDSEGEITGFIGLIRDITERKKAEYELQSSRDLLLSIIENSPLRIFWKDSNLRYMGCNTLFAKDAGFSRPDELIGKTDFEMGWKDQSELYQTDDIKVINSGKSILDFEEPQTTPNGDTIWLKTSKVPLIDKNKNILGILGIYNDITLHKMAEKKIIENESFLKETQKIANLGTYTLEFNSGMWQSGEILDSIYGIDMDYDRSVQGWLSIVHPDWRQTMKEYLNNEVIGSKKKFEKEYKIIRKSDGTVRWVHMIGKLEFDDDGRPLKMVGTVRDITEQRNAEEEIKKLNRVYAVISKTNQAIVRIKDSQKLFDEICRIAIDEGKFSLAWIGLVNNKTNRLEAAASAGATENSFDIINLYLNDKEKNNGPISITIETGSHYISNDIENDEIMLPWRVDLLNLNNKSVASLPLNVFDKTIGAFIIYSSQKYFFQKDEIDILNEMAMDISFALEFFQSELKRRRSEEIVNRFNKSAVSRELRMVELKQKINDLSKKMGTKPPYKLDFLNEDKR